MHRLPVLESKAERRHDDKQDIGEADRVPDDKHGPVSSIRERQQENREGGDADIAPAGRRGKSERQFAPAGKEEEVKPNEPCHMQKHEPAKLDPHRPPLQRWNLPAREKSQGGQCPYDACDDGGVGPLQPSRYSCARSDADPRA